MLKNALRKLVRKLVKSDIVAEAIADKADRAVVREIDKRTGGLASKIDEVI